MLAYCADNVSKATRGWLVQLLSVRRWSFSAFGLGEVFWSHDPDTVLENSTFFIGLPSCLDVVVSPLLRAAPDDSSLRRTYTR